MRTDHHSLKYLLKQKVGITTQQKWVSTLLGYEFSNEYKKGVENKVDDALSRRDNSVELESLVAITFPTPTWLT